MIYAIVGTYDDTKLGSIRGNGKTISAVFYGNKDYQDGKQVITNFYTTFSKVCGINEIVSIFKEKKLRNTLLILTEAQLYFPHQMKKFEKEELIDRLVAQSRKSDNDIILDTQRFLNLNLEIRNHVDEVLLPQKIHADDGTPCYKDNCKRDHIILVYSIREERYPITSFNAWTIGKLYDTNEVIFDKLQEPDKDKKIKISAKDAEIILKELSKHKSLGDDLNAI